MRPMVREALAHQIADAVSEAELGHCLRIDDVQEAEASELTALVAGRVDPTQVKVSVLDSCDWELGVSVPTAVGIRNDKSHVLVLFVPPGQAHAASSLDNSFVRLPLVGELQRVESKLRRELADRWPGLPLQVLLRNARVPLEARLDFLSAVLESEDEAAFGRELWRVGLIVDDVVGPELRANIQWNARLVGEIANPATITATVRERLRRAKVAPGLVFEKLVAILSPAVGDLRDTVTWTRRLFQEHGITLSDIPRDHEVESSLQAVEMQSFRKPDGAVENFSKLKSSDEGALYAETSESDPGAVGIRWKTKPGRPTDVANWLIELIPPADLRSEDAPPIIEMKVRAARVSAQLKLELSADDLSGGSLFVVRITALGTDEIPMLLADGSPAISESEPFEVVIKESLPDRTTRKASAGSLAEAQLRAVLAGAPNTALDMQAWDLGGRVFSVRFGRHVASQIRVAPLVVGLQRRVIGEPSITTFEATSQYGEAIDAATVVGETLELPGTLTKRRKELLALLKQSAPQDVPEVFRWDEGARQVAMEYAQAYKRALDAAEGDTRAALLRLDTVRLQVGTAVGAERAVVVLPIHPLRVAWIASHFAVVDSWCTDLLMLGSAKARRLMVDEDLFGQVLPTNLPFATVDESGNPFVYFDELAFGTAVLLEPGLTHPEAAATAIYGALDLPRESATLSSSADLVSKRFTDFRLSHPEVQSLRIAALNPGDGEVLGRAVESQISTPVRDGEVASIAPPRIEVVAYGVNAGFTSPLPLLSKLQRELQLAQLPGRQSHLAPPLGLALRRPEALVDDERSNHVALVQDVATQRLSKADDSGSARSAAFQDLLTPVVTARAEDGGKPVWITSPALASNPDALARAVVEAHRSQQLAVGGELGLDGPPALRITIEPDELEALRVLHELSDWVTTLDRYVGLDLYEDPLAIGLGSSSYILDYAPDFIEGLGHRLTVTTKHRAEVTRILQRAMDELGLDAVNQSVTPILENLLAISGRLVLRLQGSDNFAREAVSLAALIAHLERRGHLDDTIIVPVDSHEEIFGRATREADHAARRCDLLLVRVQRSGLRIECVEVKSRKAAAVPTQLADDIVDQLEETRRLLIARFFATDPARVDAPLQRARLAGMLHYYADRAVASGTLSRSRLAEVHRLIDRHLEGNPPVDIRMRGYVISLFGAAGFPASHRAVPITVLTAADLGKAGFSTKFDKSRNGEDQDQPSSAEVPARTPDGANEAHPPPVHRHDGTLEAEADLGEGISAPPEQASPRGTLSVADRSPLEPAVAGNPTQIDVVLGRDGHGGGDVVWSISTKGSPHSFVVGIPGQGKSVTTRRIVRTFAAAGLPSLLFDFHGDMAADPPVGATTLDASHGLPFSPFEEVDDVGPALNAAAFETAEIIAYVAGLGEIQRSHVYKALQNAYANALRNGGPGAPTIEQFAEALEIVEAASKGRHARERVRPLTDFGLFRGDARGVFDPRDGGMVVDVSAIPLDQVQLAAGAFLLRKIYREMFSWAQDGTLKLAIVLDEAHRLARDVTLPKLMKEGRKYGVVVVVASQGAADFHRDVLGNAGTKVVFRTNYPSSKQVAGYLRGRSGQDLSQEIERLGVGQAYVSTPDSPQARRVFMAQ